ncbi:MAG: GNAT family N-acetyltransferase [Lachnospiraceae bacterium]|nr:GNAT family N-acetyltransferase [Lachnospiraceae bacterium]
MKNITARQYRILSDHMDIYQFMLEIYERNWRNGVPAPFLEYALSSTWMDKSYSYLNRIWFDGDKIIGFVYTENPVTDIYFSLRPGYEEIAPEMVAYADAHMPNLEGKRHFIIFKGQDAIQTAAEKMGYQQISQWNDMQYDFDKPLDYPLPKGFHFVPQGMLDIAKISECCWKGFDHEEKEGPWDGDTRNNYGLLQSPHQTLEYGVAIENESGNYVCYAGMWWIPENQLAYMEPLCTVPEYRQLGLASAALSELYRRMKPLGATHMTGGGNPFYEKIGYHPAVTWTVWRKI